MYKEKDPLSFEKMIFRNGQPVLDDDRYFCRNVVNLGAT